MPAFSPFTFGRGFSTAVATATKAQLLAQIDALTAQLYKVEVEYRALQTERDNWKLEAQTLAVQLKACQDKNRGFVAQASRAEISLAGNSPVLAQGWWKVIPHFQIDRSKPFPQYIGGIRANYYTGPPNVTISLVEV